MGYSKYSLIIGLNDIIDWADRIRSEYPQFENDMRLNVYMQYGKFLIDIVKTCDICVYPYNKYIFEIDNAYKGEEALAHKDLLDYAFLKIDIDELFYRYPTHDDIDIKIDLECKREERYLPV